MRPIASNDEGTPRQPFPAAGDNFRTLGRIEQALSFRPRSQEEFAARENYRAYVDGREDGKDGQG